MLWIVIEWMQSLPKVSWPWTRLVLSQVNNIPILQISKWTGSIFISGLIILVNAAIAYLIVEYINSKKENPELKIFSLPSFNYLIAVLLTWFVIWGFGLWKNEIR